MTETLSPPVQGAGALLRAARQKQGLHIAALAASIKVSTAKLEALEAERYADLPDATFTRALAQSVCRALKIEAGPVLAQLPATAVPVLEKVDAGLNTPFRDRPARLVPGDWVAWRQPSLWLVLLLLLAAAAFGLAPESWLPSWLPVPGRTAPAEQAATETAPAPVAQAMPQESPPVVASAVQPPPVAERASAAAEPAAPVAPSVAAPAAVVPGIAKGSRLKASETTWVQAVDARGQVLVSRLVTAGETIDLEGARPLRLRIGNVRGAQLEHQGRTIDLAAVARENVATVDLP